MKENTNTLNNNHISGSNNAIIKTEEIFTMYRFEKIKNQLEEKNQKEDIDKIIDIELVKLLDRISELGYKLKLSKKAKSFIAEKGFDKQYGARPLKRAIQKYVEDAIAEEIIKSNIQEGDSITMDIGKNDTELSIKITSPKKSEEQ